MEHSHVHFIITPIIIILEDNSTQINGWLLTVFKFSNQITTLKTTISDNSEPAVENASRLNHWGYSTMVSLSGLR